MGEACDELWGQEATDCPPANLMVSEAEVAGGTDPVVTPEIRDAVRAWKVRDDRNHDRVAEIETAWYEAEKEAARLGEMLR